AEANTVTHGPKKWSVRKQRRKSRITLKTVKNSANRERGPSRKISSAHSGGAVKVERAAASGSLAKSSLFCTTSHLPPTIGSGAASTTLPSPGERRIAPWYM